MRKFEYFDKSFCYKFVRIKILKFEMLEDFLFDERPYLSQVPPKARAFTNVGFSNDDGRSPMYQSPAASISLAPTRRLSRRYSKWGVNQFIQTDERKKVNLQFIFNFQSCIFFLVEFVRACTIGVRQE